MSRKRVLWAVDPFTTNPDLQLRTVEALRALIGDLELELEPVYVQTKSHLEIPLREYPSSRLTTSDGPTVKETMSAETALERWCERVEMPGLSKPVCLMPQVPSTRGAVERLLGYAKEGSFDLIVLSTRARVGFPRLLLGSFAETTMLHSKLPMLIVNPHARVPKRYKEVVFPTGLSAESKAGLENLLSFATAIDASVTLFHKLQFFIADDDFTREAEWVDTTERKLEEWKALIQRSGVKCEVVLDGTSGNIAESVLKYTDSRKEAFIGVVSESGPILTSILGSVVRQLVRCAECPVWVIPSAN